MYLEERVDILEGLCKELVQQIQMLQAKGKDEYLTPLELSKRLHVSQNTIYTWIKEGRIKTLKNLGAIHRIPLSQFYDAEVEEEREISQIVDTKTEGKLQPERKGGTKSDRLKTEFESILKQKGLS